MSRQASVPVTPGLGSSCYSKDAVFGMVSVSIYTVKKVYGREPCCAGDCADSEWQPQLAWHTEGNGNAEPERGQARGHPAKLCQAHGAF